MRILLIGSGGREHAIAHTFVSQGHEVFCLPGNAGIDQICLPIPEPLRSIQAIEVEKLPFLAQQLKVDLTVIGPEDPLSKGVVDLFLKSHLPIFGPTQKAAQLESSKAYAKAFMARHQIPTARFSICRTAQEAYKVVDQFFLEKNGAVIKPSGLTAGKGVTVCPTKEEAYQAIKLMMEEGRYQEAGQQVVVEELLKGVEVSVLAFCDGKVIVPMIPSQDHKRVNDGDEGPNTGGMGAYAPAPFADRAMMDQIVKTLIEPTLKGLLKDRLNYQGVLYFGVMMTAQGPKLLEYNCRFGDPETQAVLPLLKSDLAAIMLACYQGNLNSANVVWSDQSSCCVVMASGGYPESYQTGYPIKNLESIKDQDQILVFHAGTKAAPSGEILTAGGRVLGITGVGDSLDRAIKAAYEGVASIEFQDAHYRRDIAKKASIGKNQASDGLY